MGRMNRSVVVTPSGDSADGELSEDDRDTGSSGDRTPTSSKKLHKISPKKSFSSSFGRRKAKERSEKMTKKGIRRVESSDEGSENESGDDSDGQLRSRGSRQAAKQASNAISKTISKQDKRSDQEESSSSGSDDSKDLNLRKKEKGSKDHKNGKRHSSNHDVLKKRSDEYTKCKSTHKSSKPLHRSNSISENSDFVMPELEPQVTTNLPRNLGPLLKETESPKSFKKSKSRKDEKRSQKSIKEFFTKKSTYDNISSASSQEDDAASKPEPKMEKVQKHAIERSFEANKGFLTSFESFQCNDGPKSSKELKIPKVRDERKDEKSYTLIASTLHPKKVLKEELKKDKRKEEERKRFEDDKSKLEDEHRGLKRKEREWEEEKQREKDEILKKEKFERKKKEREERKRQEREEKDRLEKEKENLRVKEQMLIEKRKQKEEEKEKVEFDK